MKEIMLKIAESRQRDVGHGRIRMSNSSMRSIDVSPGDIVELSSANGKTGATVFLSYKEDQNSDRQRSPMEGHNLNNSNHPIPVNLRSNSKSKSLYITNPDLRDNYCSNDLCFLTLSIKSPEKGRFQVTKTSLSKISNKNLQLHRAHTSQIKL